MKKIIVTLLLMANYFAIYSRQLNIATYNIRYENKEDSLQGNAWSKRRSVICDMVRYHDFDIWGAQEVLHGQLMDLQNCLSEYNYVGVGRDDGKMEGEYTPIFYKKDRFICLRSGHFWLSSVTDMPNKGWDAVLPRVCTWLCLQEIETNRTFWCFNLHFDHVGVSARRESAKLLKDTINAMCGNEPVILTGDFNVDQRNESYLLLQNSDRLNDSYEMAKIRFAPTGTFNAFNPNQNSDSRIDHIFVSPDFEVVRYGVLTDTYRDNRSLRLPSDHFPVKVELKW